MPRTFRHGGFARGKAAPFRKRSRGPFLFRAIATVGSGFSVQEDKWGKEAALLRKAIFAVMLVGGPRSRGGPWSMVPASARHRR